MYLNMHAFKAAHQAGASPLWGCVCSHTRTHRHTDSTCSPPACRGAPDNVVARWEERVHAAVGSPRKDVATVNSLLSSRTHVCGYWLLEGLDQLTQRHKRTPPSRRVRSHNVQPHTPLPAVSCSIHEGGRPRGSHLWIPEIAVINPSAFKRVGRPHCGSW